MKRLRYHGLNNKLFCFCKNKAIVIIVDIDPHASITGTYHDFISSFFKGLFLVPLAIKPSNQSGRSDHAKNNFFGKASRLIKINITTISSNPDIIKTYFSHKRKPHSLILYCRILFIRHIQAVKNIP